MHHVPTVRAVATIDKRSLRLVALPALWPRSEKATSSG